jgi:gluconate 2-dehydrogenase gamma chain
LESTSQQKFKKPFGELAWDEQTTILESLESGQVNKALWPTVSPQYFFRLVRDHTMQGFYGSPRHGGNKNYLSYKMLELDYPHIIGQNRYTQGMDKPNGWIEN